ncbi:MAG: glycoside hydrolase family 97 protein [Cyclobacteriaceae bacterium]|nr:glycoside hydrolase family 97 protein [Cyclobacteriaceae bacterium]
MKYMNACFLWLSIWTVATTQAHAQTIQLRSPDHHLKLNAVIAANGGLTYELHRKGIAVVKPSVLGFVLSRPEVRLDQFELLRVDSSLVDNTWKPLWGEVSTIRNFYTEVKLSLRQKTSPGIRLNVVFRLFNDGMGLRYEFPEQPGFVHFTVKDELTAFSLAGDHKAFWIPGDFDSNEYSYQTSRLSEIDATKAAAQEKDIAVTAVIGPHSVQTPLMMKSGNGLYINVHEAALINYPALNLTLDPASLTLQATLVPDVTGNKAWLQTPFSTPWRTVIVSDMATEILASKLILNLNAPPPADDYSWIKPQKFLGVWWEMHVGKATWQMAGGKHGATTDNTKRYIDFASRHGFDGVLVEGWNAGWEDWFGNWKEEVFDFVTPYPDYDLQELTAYARSKGVKLIMHHETSGSVTNYERRLDTAYRFMKYHGMETVKTGYVGKIIPRGEHHDGQWMVNHYNRVAEKTRSYRIMLDAHEPVHPTGLHRTFPNWMANEAARGSEFNNAPTLGITPEHTTILPFTRLMGGPMDFTPGLFHMQLNQFDPARSTRVRTTLAKQLALYVTMYSPLQMAADLPENYEQYPDAFQFIKDVAVDWDDTRILEAEPGDYITIARKAKGTTSWFLGAITDENARELNVKLDFLDDAVTYEATVYQDAPGADWDHHPELYQIRQVKVTRKSQLKVPLAPGGGCAVALRKIK